MEKDRKRVGQIIVDLCAEPSYNGETIFNFDEREGRKMTTVLTTEDRIAAVNFFRDNMAFFLKKNGNVGNPTMYHGTTAEEWLSMTDAEIMSRDDIMPRIETLFMIIQKLKTEFKEKRQRCND